MENYSTFFWLTISICLIFTAIFIYLFYKKIWIFITSGINWLFLLHIVFGTLICLAFSSYFSQFIDMLNQKYFSASVNQPILNLTIGEIQKNNLDIFNTIERISLAIFALFIPLLLTLYINYYKDIFGGVDKLTTYRNAASPNNLTEECYNDIILKLNTLQNNFSNYSNWLKMLFYVGIVLLLVLVIAPFYLYNIQDDNLKFVVLNILRGIGYINVLTFITLLFSYLKLIIPIYQHLYNPITIIKN